MHIIFGVQGEGLGHAVNQFILIQALLERDHVISILTEGDALSFFRSRDLPIPLFEIHSNRVFITDKGVDFKATSRNALTERFDPTKSLFALLSDLSQCHSEPPKLVISDMLPEASPLAALFDIPLIAYDAQSKFLGFAYPEVQGHTPHALRSWLRYCSPRPVMRLATSTILPPYAPLTSDAVKIIGSPDTAAFVFGSSAGNAGAHVVAYLGADLGSVGSENSWIQELFSNLATLRKLNFTIFHRGTRQYQQENCEIRAFDLRRFREAMQQSCAFVGTAGSGTIAECLKLCLPMYLLPNSTYEQQYNAFEVEHFGCGVARSELTPPLFAEFYDHLHRYRYAMQSLISDPHRVHYSHVEEVIAEIESGGYLKA